MKNPKKIGRAIVLLGAGFLAAGLLLCPRLCMESARGAVELCLNVVIPSLFPFFVCSGLFVSLGAAHRTGRLLAPVMRPLFRVPGAGAAAFVLGIISGYPVGAKCAADLYRSGECTKAEAERLLAFCNNSGPLFVLGAVGVGMLHSPQLGRLLYLSHILSALLTGLLFRFYGGKGRERRALPPSGAVRLPEAGAAVGDAVSGAVDTMLKVCAFVVLFSVIGALLPHSAARSFLYGLLEITGGIRAWTEGGTGTFRLCCVSLFLAFSGVSVLLQVSSIVVPGGLSVKPYVLGKLIQGGISFGLTALLLRLVPSEAPASAVWGTAAPMPLLTPRSAFLLTLLMIGWFLLSAAALWLAARLYEHWNGKK